MSMLQIALGVFLHYFENRIRSEYFVSFAFTTLLISIFLVPLILSDELSILAIGKSGIPVKDYGYIDGIYIGPQVNPLLVSTSAYDNYSIYVNRGGEVYKQSFLNGADWLVNNAVDHGNYSILEYYFPWPQYNLTSPWQSGMAQALAAKTLLRAHQVTEDEKYLEAARKLINSFFVEVKDGSVTYKSNKDGWWYEEYAGPGGKQPRVLNGMMYSLLGIYDYYKYTNDSKAMHLFDQGVLSLKKALPLYDDNAYSYSYYDILGTTNPLFYHNVHIDLLHDLYNLTSEPLFAYYATRWESYSNPPFLD